ncbi:MAG: hypothetical protein ACJ79K_06650 [Gemmatimonadaceae bacterium]
MRRPKPVSMIALVHAAVAGGMIAGCRHPAPQTPPPAVARADTSPPAAQGPVATPLAGLAGQHIVVLPVHYIRADTIGFASRITDQRGTMAALDSAIERAFGERGLSTSWTYPPALERSARRNAGYVNDPHALAAERLRAGIRVTDTRLAEPLASQLRGIIAVTDARYVLFPVELRFERALDGRVRPILHVVLLDARGSSVRWAGDVRGAASSDVTPVTLESVAFALADLVAAP